MFTLWVTYQINQSGTEFSSFQSIWPHLSLSYPTSNIINLSNHRERGDDGADKLQGLFIDLIKSPREAPLRCWHTPPPEGRLVSSLTLLLAAFNKSPGADRCTDIHADGTWWSDACTRNNADVCLPLSQIRVFRGRWWLRRARWCWGTRRPRSTASSPPNHSQHWSGIMKMSCWQTRLGMLRAKSSLLLYSFLSHHPSLTPPLPPTSCPHFIPSPFLPLYKLQLQGVLWTQWGGTLASGSRLCVCCYYSVLKMDCTLRNIITGTEHSKVSLQSTIHHLNAAFLSSLS